jgi:1-acyl-sn-glycerol-3-phosphate acyltransferase
VSETDVDALEIGKWDPDVTKAVVGLLRPIVKRYYRSEVHGLQHIPRGGGLLVSNHSGGELPMDWQVFVVDFYDEFGYDRPIYSLAHDAIFHGPQSEFLLRLGVNFAGHKGYVRTAIDAQVPIVPVVSIGGQENELYLSRGTRAGAGVHPAQAQ